MSNSPQPKPPSDDDVRAIPKWAERYAQNRTLLPARVVSMVVAALLGVAIALLLSVFVSAWRAGNAVQSGLCLAAAAATLAGLAWLVFTRRLQAAMQAACNALDRGEGHVVASSSPEAQQRGRSLAGLIVAVLGIMTPVTVQHLGVPTRYVQPLVALYLVPPLAWLHWPKSPVGGPLMLLWPGLYALHALLLLAGVPLPAVPEPMVNVFIPLVLYGMVAIVASHVYGRFALRRLRRLASTDENQATEGQPQ
jgi:hypothetical protein